MQETDDYCGCHTKMLGRFEFALVRFRNRNASFLMTDVAMERTHQILTEIRGLRTLN